jgi:hypothetical protein
MKSKLIATIGILFCLLAIPSAVWADSTTWTPPAEKGTIYIFIKYRTTFGPQPTKVSIFWGNWNLNETFNPPKQLMTPGNCCPEGFIIVLKHKKNDSIPININTNGTIERNKIYQGAAPLECNSAEYKCHNR